MRIDKRDFEGLELEPDNLAEKDPVSRRNRHISSTVLLYS